MSANANAYAIDLWAFRGDWYANVRLTDTFGEHVKPLENGIGPDRIEDVVLDAARIIAEHEEVDK